MKISVVHNMSSMVEGPIQRSDPFLHSMKLVKVGLLPLCNESSFICVK
jgi:hypothetical protein